MLEDAEKFFNKNKEAILNDYFTFLSFPSIATDPNHHKDVIQCADWLAEYLSDAGLHVQRWETEGAPVLFATDLRAGSDKETLLIYAHYDVQPVDPLEEWLSPPFEPTMRDGYVYARGASDDKGQCFYTLQAIKAFLEHYKQLPVNLKFIIEGEEESGSTHLFSLLEQKQEDLKADHLLIVDSGIEDLNTPAITLGARGIVTMTLTLQEADYDLHSGMAGGIAYNPNRAMVELLSCLHDRSNTVAVPGFYDEVMEMTPKEKEEIDFSFDEVAFEHNFGFKPRGMEEGLNPYEMSWIRPTLEINGISGGYSGEGFKTVIPARATAKLSCRLVPKQMPERTVALVADFLHKNVPENLKLDIDVHPGHGSGFRESGTTKIAQVVSQSYGEVFKKGCKKILIGGSVPITTFLKEASGADTLLIGTALPDDRVHAPNERFSLEAFEKGFLTMYHTLQLLLA